MKRPGKDIEIKVIETVQENKGNTWMVPYGNLMTVLMILFLILYCFTYMMDKKQYEQVLGEMQQEMGGEKSTKAFEKILKEEKVGQMEAALEEKGLKKFVDVIINEEGMKFNLKNDVLFSLGSAELGHDARVVLKEVVGFLMNSEEEVVVEGYTCDTPVRQGRKYKSNWELSAARAFSVVRYFASLGVEPERLSAIGYGKYRPLFPNDTSDHRALNRRIEINVVKKM